MSLSDLNEHDRNVVWECVRAAVFGPFFPDWEFQTLFGFERDELRKVLDTWQTIDDSDDHINAAISNSMNWLLFYPIDESGRWNEFISVGSSEVERVFADWRGAAPDTPIDCAF